MFIEKVLVYDYFELTYNKQKTIEYGKEPFS